MGTPTRLLNHSRIGWLLLPLLPLASLGCSGSDDDYSPTPPATLVYDPGSWDNATVYFVITDRFLDGNSSNNNAYGRQPDGLDEIGTFHGGDFRGITQKLEEDYFSALGVSVLWITAPYEQIHGWVPGANSEFIHYPYHGYWPLDFTRLDANYGTEEELMDLVDTAHRKGIRVLLDVVMNHAGYANIGDLAEFQVDVLKPGWENATLDNYYDLIDFQDPDFASWWGVDWIRAGLGGGYDPGGTDDLTKNLAYLPDFKTEDTTPIDLPPFYALKSDSLASHREGYAVRDYLVEWLTEYVSTYGIDGFRCDTVKHVEGDAWLALKEAGHVALVSWRAAHPEKAFDDALYPDPSRPFWMVGEVFGHGVSKDGYYAQGFDALINFNFQDAASKALGNPLAIDELWQYYAESLNSDPDFNALSYVSSHDTSLFFDRYAEGSLDKQKQAGSLLLLTPGAVQIFYGDENARPPGPKTSDAQQATRSDYLWNANPEVLDHWARLGRFRRKHEAVGAGNHTKLADAPYTFKRSLGDDVVYVVLRGDADESGDASVEVGADWPDGTSVRDAYYGRSTTVQEGKVSLPVAPTGVLLLEKM